jgi:hypothetical protein
LSIRATFHSTVKSTEFPANNTAKRSAVGTTDFSTDRPAFLAALFATFCAAFFSANIPAIGCTFVAA